MAACTVASYSRAYRSNVLVLDMLCWRRNDFRDDGQRPRLYFTKDPTDVFAKNADGEELQPPEEKDAERDRGDTGALGQLSHNLPDKTDQRAKKRDHRDHSSDQRGESQ